MAPILLRLISVIFSRNNATINNGYKRDYLILEKPFLLRA